ncbi:C40 family peptidase [Allostreptomyces psammosilenae]|uniref:Cell wall-associated NlpC family hydrolase n=1 Tax=Allostreptomyces psammosilenae TaxID=1892865 RepID=A0A853A216_9ACTN|nr:cell wall-associated NlpC family hydrolase [Allostreptomyces psammosilenae]
MAVTLPFALLALLVAGVFVAAGGGTSSNGAGGSGRLAAGTVPAEYAALIQEWGNLCPALSPAILAAQLYQESGFNPRAVSPVGASGIGQFMPGTWETHGMDANGDGVRNVWDPQDAIPSAASYDCAVASYVAEVPGDPSELMLAAYNAGPYAVIRYSGIPPYEETRGYVERITSLVPSFEAPEQVVAYSGQAAGAIYYAQSKLGVEYLWGGEGRPEEGGRFDCSGLTQAAYASVGIALPRVANDQWYAGSHPSRDQLLPGDLVFFAHDLNDPRSIYHVGLYVGGGKMINAPYTGAVIRYDDIDKPDYIGATRVTTDAAAALPERDEQGQVVGPARPRETALAQE